jgi:hypothetical protein
MSEGAPAEDAHVFSSSAEVARRHRGRGNTANALLLLCGAAAALIYVAADTLAASRYDGYSYADQTISELSAIDAPTRSLWLPFGELYSALTIAFALGIGLVSGGRRTLQVIAGSVFAVGVLGLVAWPFAPMHQREVLAAGGGTATDTFHLILGGVDSFLFLVCIALGAGTFGRGFRWYSIATIVALMACGAYTASQGSNVSSDEATPFAGIAERVAVFGSMTWLAVFGICLWRREAVVHRDE